MAPRREQQRREWRVALAGINHRKAGMAALALNNTRMKKAAASEER